MYLPPLPRPARRPRLICAVWAQVYDVQAETLVRTLEGHLHRVASLAWNGNAQLSSGSRDASVMNHDLRVGGASECTSVLRGHSQEICGLSWSSDGKLLASGSNDNTLRIWDAAKPCGARHVFSQHTAAVKALAWHPTRRHLLASGGGTSDRTIRFWNASTGAERSSIHTGSRYAACCGRSTTRMSCSPPTASPTTSSLSGATLRWSKWRS